MTSKYGVRLGLAGLGTLAVVAIVVMALDGARVCTKMGATSSVAVTPGDGVELVEVCLDGWCHQSGSDQTLVVNGWGIPVDDEARTYGYTISAIGPDGPVASSGTVETDHRWVNGKGCEPRTANAALLVEADGTTVEVDR